MGPPRIFLDVETVCDPLDEHWGTAAADLRETEEGEAYLKTGLYPSRNRVVYLAVAVDNGPVEGIGVTHTQGAEDRAWWDAEERQQLDFLRDQLDKGGVTRSRPGILVGHNIIGFDLPVLRLRALRDGHPLLKWFPWDRKPWNLEARVHDTLAEWRGPSWQRGGARLPDLLHFFGIDPVEEDEGDGSNVYQWFVDGREALIAKHCLADVHEVREVCRRLYPDWRV